MAAPPNALINVPVLPSFSSASFKWGAASEVLPPANAPLALPETFAKIVC